jgi:hypothetical protein
VIERLRQLNAISVSSLEDLLENNLFRDKDPFWFIFSFVYFVFITVFLILEERCCISEMLYCWWTKDWKVQHFHPFDEELSICFSLLPADLSLQVYLLEFLFRVNFINFLLVYLILLLFPVNLFPCYSEENFVSLPFFVWEESFHSQFDLEAAMTKETLNLIIVTSNCVSLLCCFITRVIYPIILFHCVLLLLMSFLIDNTIINSGRCCVPHLTNHDWLDWLLNLLTHGRIILNYWW